MRFNPASPVNEIGQIVVELPQYTYRKSNFILVKDEGTDYQIFSHTDERDMFGCTSVIAKMCGSRAKFTVRGGLLLHGTKVKPQQYLRHWRSIEPIDIGEMKTRHGMALYVKVCLMVEAERAAKWCYHVDPHHDGLKSFAAFEEKYGHGFTTNPDTGFHEAQFDLVDPVVSLDLEQLACNIRLTRGSDPRSHLRFRLVELGTTPAQLLPPSNRQLDLLEMF